MGHTQSVRRWTLVVGATLCALLAGMGYLLWQDAKSGSAIQPNALQASSLRIHRPGFDDIDLIKGADGWQIQSPCTIAVNEQRLTPLLGALASPNYQYEASEVDLEAAGLTKPLASVFINEQEHRIGNTDLRGDRRYILRGNVVELAPEWVLSLVNGGLTAIARLKLFTTPLQQILHTDIDGTSRDLSSTQSLSDWQEISAEQIITWPPTTGELDLSYTLQVSDTLNTMKTLQVYNTEQFVAIRHEGAACAYILGTDSLPES